MNYGGFTNFLRAIQHFLGMGPWLVAILCWGPLIGQQPTSSSSATPLAYLYLDAGEIRLEGLLPLELVLSEIGKPASDSLSPDEVRQLLEEITVPASSWLRWVASPHTTSPLPPPTMSIILLTDDDAIPLSENAPVPVRGRYLGVSWVLPSQQAPDLVQVEWKGPGTWGALSGRVMVGSQSAPFTLSATEPVYTWRNEGRLHLDIPPLSELPAPSPVTVTVPILSLALLLLALTAVIYTWRRRLRHSLTTAVSLLILLGSAWLSRHLLPVQLALPGQSAAMVPRHEAEATLQGLLLNIYRAFDHREESVIYDALAQSVDGPLLQDLYVQIHQALTIDTREGARARVRKLVVKISKITPLHDQSGYRAEARWTVLGSIGHWGHHHQRVQQHQAEITLQPVQGWWKITSLQLNSRPPEH